MRRIGNSELKSFRHPKEGPRFTLSILVVVPLLIALILGTFGGIFVIVPFVLFFLWFLLRLYLAKMLNNSVLITPKSFPQVHEMITESKETFGFSGSVEAYVIEDGSYNASVMPLLRRKVLLLNSEVLADGADRLEVRFLVGRFIGALASRHFRFAWLQLFIASFEKLVIFNILLTPYQRAVQLTGDQLGLVMIDGDVGTAVSAIKKLMVGKDVADQVSLEGFLEQGLITRGSFFSWLARAVSPFPHTTTRVANLLRFGAEKFPEETRAFISQFPESTKKVAKLSALGPGR